MRKLLIGLLVIMSFVSCEKSEAKVYKGTLFMSFVDDFENGKSQEIYEIKLIDGMKTLVFDNEPPKEIKSSVGKKITIIGSENKEGDILFEKVATEQE